MAMTKPLMIVARPHRINFGRIKHCTALHCTALHCTAKLQYLLMSKARISSGITKLPNNSNNCHAKLLIKATNYGGK